MLRGSTIPYVAGGTLILLVLMAVIQYRWIESITAGERSRLTESLRSASARLADDIDGLLLDTAQVLREELRLRRAARDDPARQMSEAFNAWRNHTASPELIEAIYLSSRAGDQVQRLTDMGGLEPIAAPQQLAALLDSLARLDPPPMATPVEPALLIHLEEPIPRGSRSHQPPRPPRLVIVQLDLAWLQSSLIPGLLERHFAGLDYTLEISCEAPGRPVIFRHPPELVSGAGPADVTLSLFRLTEPEPTRRRHDLARADRAVAPTKASPRHLGPLSSSGERSGAVGLWRLDVNHRTGSLEQAASRLYRRNLAMGGGVLALLAASLAMLVISSQRAQRLARQQIQLVAGVSHELKTPLAAIRSAGENLAHGVVTDPTRVRQYGALVDREGKRLTGLIGELLELAGLQGRQRPTPRAPIRINELVRDVIEDCSWAAAEQEIEIEQEIEPGLPPVKGDAQSLHRALRNLVENAIKHGGEGRWVRISAQGRPGAGQVELRVTDRGPGISRKDLPHVFEPFYRGHGRAARASGSGLGLALAQRVAQAHDGKIEVETGKHGTTMALILPEAGDIRPGQTSGPGCPGRRDEPS